MYAFEESIITTWFPYKSKTKKEVVKGSINKVSLEFEVLHISHKDENIPEGLTLVSSFDCSETKKVL